MTRLGPPINTGVRLRASPRYAVRSRAKRTFGGKMLARGQDRHGHQLIEPETNESHRANGVMPTVERDQRIGHEVDREQPAGAEAQMVCNTEVADCSERHF